MARKKLNLKRIDFNITETNYKRLLILCNEETTLTDMINQCIEWKYNGIYKKPEGDKRPTDPLFKNLTPEEQEQIEVANLNWLEGDSNA